MSPLIFTFCSELNSTEGRTFLNVLRGDECGAFCCGPVGLVSWAQQGPSGAERWVWTRPVM